MKKAGRALGVLIVLMLFLSGCGWLGTGMGEEAVQEEGDGNDSATELTFWTFMALHTQHYEKMLELWNQQNPERKIKLNIREMEYNEMHNKLLLAVQSGDGMPDIADVEIGEFPRFTSLQEIPLEALDDAAAPYEADILSSRMDIYRQNGILYAYPTHVGTMVAFYNTDLLEDAGIDYHSIVTWEDFEKAGIEFHRKTGKYLGMAETGSVWQACLVCTEQGTDLVGENGNPQVNSEEMVKGFEMLKKLQDENVLHVTKGGHPDNAETMEQLENGEFACVMMPVWYMSRFTGNMLGLRDKMAIAPVPVFEEGQPRSAGLGGTGTVVPKGAANKELAKEFAAFAKLSEEANIQIWKGLGFDPCNISIWKNHEITHDADNLFIQFFKNNPFDVLNELLEGEEIISMRTAPAVSVIYDDLRDVALEDIFIGGKDVREALEGSQRRIEEKLRE